MCNTEIIYHATSNVDLFFFFSPFFRLFFFCPLAPCSAPCRRGLASGATLLAPWGDPAQDHGVSSSFCPFSPLQDKAKGGGAGHGGTQPEVVPITWERGHQEPPWPGCSRRWPDPARSEQERGISTRGLAIIIGKGV